MTTRSLTGAQLLELLASAPPRLAALTAGAAPARLHAAPDPASWSANEVLAHLRACADVWGGCIARIITEERPTLRWISPRTWITRTDYLAQQFPASLQAFTAQRAELLALLEQLPPEGWSRAAIVKRAGKMQERTVRVYAESLVTHARPHLDQIEQLLTAG